MLITWIRSSGRWLQQLFIVLLEVMILSGCSGDQRYHREISKLMTEQKVQYETAALIGEYQHFFPENTKQLAGYAQTLLEYGFYDECIHVCNHVLNKEKDSWSVLYTRAVAYSNIWKFDNSLADFEKLDKNNWLDPDKNDLFVTISQQDAIFQEILLLNQQIRENTDRLDLFSQRGNLYLSMNEPEPAIFDYQYFLDSSGYNLDVILNKFRAEILTGDFTAAEEDVRQIKQNYHAGAPLNPDVLTGILNETKKYTEQVKSNPEQIQPYFELARIFTSLNLEFQAIEKLRIAQSIEPDNLQIRYRMALVFISANEPDKAKKILLELQANGMQLPDQLRTYIE